MNEAPACSNLVTPSMLGDYLDTVTAATVLVFSNKYHKINFAAPNLEKPYLNIK